MISHTENITFLTTSSCTLRLKNFFLVYMFNSTWIKIIFLFLRINSTERGGFSGRTTGFFRVKRCILQWFTGVMKTVCHPTQSSLFKLHVNLQYKVLFGSGLCPETQMVTVFLKLNRMTAPQSYLERSVFLLEQNDHRKHQAAHLSHLRLGLSKLHRTATACYEPRAVGSQSHLGANHPETLLISVFFKCIPHARTSHECRLQVRLNCGVSECGRAF